MSHHFSNFLEFLLLVDVIGQRIDFDVPAQSLFQLVNRLVLLLAIMVHWIGCHSWRILLLLRAIVQLKSRFRIFVRIKSLVQQLARNEPAECGLSLVAGHARLLQPDLSIITNLLQKAFILPFD